MEKFELYEDVKVQSWRRYLYSIEAESLEAAVQQIIDGNADCTDLEELYDFDYFMDPRDNAGNATREIYRRDNDELLYMNIENT